MAKIICLFSHKGGVSKTTTSYNLAWMLTEKKKRVLLVDADSQCNLTKNVFGDEIFEQFYIDHPKDNIKDYLAPAFDALPKTIEPAASYTVKNNENLLIIPGSFDLSEYEVSLGVSFTLSETMRTLKNLPGSFRYLIDVTVKKYDIDYVIVDMNPSLSAINQALLVSCDFFIVPTAPDNFSIMAIQSLARVLPKWEMWADRARRIFSEDTVYPLPKKTPKFLGTVIQRFNIRDGKPTKANETLIESINKNVQSIFVDNLRKVNMLLKNDKYTKDFCLAYISDFQGLNAEYQKYGVPIFALSDDQLKIKYQGAVLTTYQDMRKRFYDKFSNFADKVIEMTSNG